jgi:uncharacterized protein (TIRG00374 family)
MNKSLKILASIIITVILVTMLLSQIQIADVTTTLAGIDPLYLFVGFGLYVLSYFFRALRFRILLNKKVGLKNLFTIVCVHNMMNNILPARTGELSYIYLLKKHHNKTAGEGIATLFVARVFDIISITLLFSVSALMIKDLPDMVAKVVFFIVFFLALVIVFLITLLYSGNSFLNLVGMFFERFGLEDKRIVGYMLRKGSETVESFEMIKTNGRFIEMFTISIGIWLSLYLLNYTLVIAMGINLNFFTIVLASTFAVFTTVLPIQGVGGFGTIEGGWAIGFVAAGLTKEVAISSGFGVHIITIFYFIIIGLFGYSVIKLKEFQHNAKS